MKKQINSLAGISVALLFLLITSELSAQINVTGKVEDFDGNLLPFTNVLLLNTGDSSLVKGTVAGQDGKFLLINVTDGEYLVKGQMVGYQPVYADIKINHSSDLQPVILQMKEDIHKLEDIVISAQKPLYEKLTDRTIVNVRSSITSTGKTALEVLERSPGVMVNRQSNSITMYGKSGVKVMINGKSSQMPLDAVVQMLNGMSSANIEKVELITSPPAKYDAEGSAGIINIIMAENSDLGTNSNVGITGGYNTAETFGGNFNFNHRGNRLNLFMDYSILFDKNHHDWIDRRLVPGKDHDQSVISNMFRPNKTTVQNLRTGLEYELGGKTNLKLLLTGYHRYWKLYDGITNNTHYAAPDSVIHTIMNMTEDNRWQSGTGSLGLRHQLNDHQELALEYDYLYYHNNNPSFYNFTTTSGEKGSGEEQMLDVSKKTPITFHVFKADYRNRITDKLLIEAGLKGTVSRFENSVKVNSLEGGHRITDPKFTGESTLDEKIFAGYLSWKWKLGADLNIDGGLRFEHTDTYLSTEPEQGLVDRKLDNLFPNLNISKKLGHHQAGLSYSRRITRPTFNEIAPFVLFTGPNSFFAGNPSLRPAIANSFDLKYQFQQWWVNLNHSNIDDNIGLLQPELNSETNEMIFRSHNQDYLRSWSISSGFPLLITSWWELQTDFSIISQQFKTKHLETNFAENDIMFHFNATHSLTLSNNYFAEISGNYQSKSLWGIWEFKPRGQLNLGIKKKLSNDKGSISLSFTDVFNTSIWKSKAVLPGDVKTNWSYDWSIQSVNLTFNMNFGNKKIKSVNIDSGSSEERRRVN